MSMIRPRRAGRAPSHAQAGVVAVEFALLAVCFFVFVFGMMELARALYMWNTLQEATRRAAREAARTDFTDAAAMDALRRRALPLRDAAGRLALGAPVTDAHIRVDYLSLQPVAGVLTPTPVGPMPGCPARNLVNCADDPYGVSCIRFVRVRLCQPAAGADLDACLPVPYQPLTGLIALPPGFELPVSSTLVKAETLGYRAGAALCP